ncbi:MAG: CCR4-NOT transcription complex subunit 2, NOT2 [Amphiamblys sp. WSBS2006]|nr:MAG: CCR4-NOT transcription complex subunit 2, NOT2 [Amphiamblys sp. WSBS2006]
MDGFGTKARRCCAIGKGIGSTKAKYSVFVSRRAYVPEIRKKVQVIGALHGHDKQPACFYKDEGSLEVRGAMEKGNTNREAYGLDRLVELIKEEDEDRRGKTLGLTISKIGISLEGKEVYRREMGDSVLPRQEERQSGALDFRDGRVIPECYTRQKPPELTPQIVTGFTEDTLFYIFYEHARSPVQVIAANELKRRGWVFSQEIVAWIYHAEDGSKDRQTVVFDAETWTRRPRTEDGG